MQGWKILLAIAIVGMFVMPMMPATKADNITFSVPHRWYDQKLIWWIWSVAKYANDDNEMNKVISGKTVYEHLNILFDGCTTMRDFFDGVENLCGDAGDPDEGNKRSELPRWKRRLSEIVETIINDDDPPTYLFCHQQAILLAAGIKARFSQPCGSTYVLKSGYGDFTFYFNMGQDGQLTGHIQLVVDKWNGDDAPNGADKWEMDTWEGPPGDQYRAWDPSYGWGDNSKMWTSNSR
ncbi:MAG: hypothetical protein U9M97_01665, partial [Candidatus Hadarchaeota archaeon]|nr:hypothetical protein [Candidatus Hadarchaeota archaeon]